jgi:hypothetical protein
MEIIISNLIVGVLIILAYTLGLKKGNSNMIIPNIIKVAKNPIKTIKESIEEKEKNKLLEEEARKLSIAINNIENYNGDSIGQEDVN